MKRLLILAYDFPPYVSVGGLRPYAWYKYLKEFGVEPIVVTRQWENKHGNALDYIEASTSKETIVENTEYGTIIRAPYFPSLSNRLLLKYGEKRYSKIRKSLTAFDEIRQFIVPSGPKSTLYHAAKKYLKENKVDAIIATGEPFVLFSFASKLSKKFGIPWIADYRDPWSQNGGRSRGIFKWLNPFFEKKLLKTVKLIITVGEFFKYKINQFAPDNTQILLLSNGYDEDNFKRIGLSIQSSEKLQISFVGTIYDWHPWQSFLEVFSIWLRENQNSNIQLNFYGINKEKEMKDYISTALPNLKEKVIIFPRISNKEIVLNLAESNVLLLFNYYSFLGTKIYDYLAAKRGILLCYENDDKALSLKKQFYTLDELPECSQRLQAEVIEKTKSGIVVQDEKHLYEVLTNLWNEFKENKKIECNSSGIEEYSRKIQVKKLAEILHSV